jgi:hypothetical protein
LSYIEVPILYFTEQKRFSDSDGYLARIFEEINDERVISVRQGQFIFNYVGIISLPFCTVSVLPKYVDSNLSFADFQEATRYHVQILQQYSNVSQKYDGLDFLATKPDDIYYSEPVLADNLINYYVRYGIYEKEEKVYTVNGPRAINWQMTVEKTAPLITRRSIFYSDTINSVKKVQTDETITLLHLWATKYCIKKYSCLLPGYDGIEFNANAPDDLDEIGPVDFLIATVHKELRFVFADVKIGLLNNLIWLLEQKKSSNPNEGISFYGSSSYHFVWEDACKRAFNDLSENASIKSLFKAPSWISNKNDLFSNENASQLINKRNLLIPDVIGFDSETDTLLVLDAKYYDIKFKGTQIFDNPGIGDISKQILYQQILTKSSKSQFESVTNVFNGFIFPYNPANHKFAETWSWGHIESNIAGWETLNIHVLLIPHREIFDCYVNNKVFKNLFSKLSLTAAV